MPADSVPKHPLKKPFQSPKSEAVARLPAGSNDWDALALPWNAFRQKPSGALVFFLPFARGRVLDAGCGNGRNAKVLAEKAARVTAMDASEQMVALARKNLAGLSGADVAQGRLETLLFADASFDAIFCLAALHHVRPMHLAATLSGFWRVLKPGGHVCVAVWNRDQTRFRNKPAELDVPWQGKSRYYHLMTLAELTALAQKSGFAVVDAFLETRGRKVAENGQNACVIAQKR